MRINDVIRRKGSTVVTIAPSQTVRQLLDLLAEHRIGAVVVSTDGRTIEGIVSERDIVRHLQTRGAEVLSAQVREIMTPSPIAIPDTLPLNLAVEEYFLANHYANQQVNDLILQQATTPDPAQRTALTVMPAASDARLR